MKRRITTGIFVLCLMSALSLPTATAADSPNGNGLDVSFSRTDNFGPTVKAGSRLTYTLTFTNRTHETVTVYPRTSSLAKVAVEGDAGNCRWVNLAPGASFPCSFGYHVALDRDAATGFTPTVTVDLTRDRAGTNVVRAGITRTGQPVTVKPTASSSQPLAYPAAPTDGAKLRLATAGAAGFACHRIPALTRAPNGWLLAAWDGRPGNCADAPQANSILERISRDNGRTWSAPLTIAAGAGGSPRFGYSDPSFVTDRVTGTVFAFFVKAYDRGIRDSRAGSDPSDRNVLHAAVTSSNDNGLTWGEPRIITAQVSSGTHQLGRFATSGEGIQLRYGPHAGRLVQQYSINVGPGVALQAMSVYSDDHGKTWRHGAPVGSVLDPAHHAGMDENKVVELSDGTLLLNSRTTLPGQQTRLIARSKDGGETYSPAVAEPALIDPHNNASIIRAYPNAPRDSACAKVLLFSNAATRAGRTTGTIRVSRDNGRTWSAGRVFEPGTMQYSTMTALATPGHYGLLYEGAVNGAPAITYMPFSMTWLGEHFDCPAQPTKKPTGAASANPGDTSTTSPATPGDANGTPATQGPQRPGKTAQTPPASQPGASGGQPVDKHADGNHAGTPSTTANKSDSATAKDTPGAQAGTGLKGTPTAQARTDGSNGNAPGASTSRATTPAASSNNRGAQHLAATGVSTPGLLAVLVLGVAGAAAAMLTRRRQ